jgi:hypothetical protein
MQTGRTPFTIAAAVAVALTAACGYQSPTGPAGTPAAVESVRLSVAANPLEVGQATIAKAIPIDFYGAQISPADPANFVSSVPGVARVQADTGIILAIAPGMTTITGTIDGKSASVTVTVVPASGQ